MIHKADILLGTILITPRYRKDCVTSILQLREEQSGGTDDQNSSLPTWLGLFFCKQVFILCSENSPNLTCYIKLSVHQRYLHCRKGAQCRNFKGYSAAPMYVVNLMIFQPFLLQHTQKSIKLHIFLMKLSKRFLTRLVVC